ncbi:hypothetical protein [Mycobacteroides franklinii]|uniref:hypothetical protein n=1 Tax=Mycobacteroides franklinii TaxID=948102 RepID=UPI0013E8DA5B|nr:hypothetical protein [Mycobacteroides franklinii]
MALDPIDTKKLMLKDGTLSRLRSHFENLRTDIQTEAQKFNVLDCDLGMQECAEGRSWDGLVNDAYLKVYNAMKNLAKDAEEFQGRLTDIENAYDTTEQRNANNFQKLDRANGWPTEKDK